jgi:predicted MFS family arabinose efflux permease
MSHRGQTAGPHDGAISPRERVAVFLTGFAAFLTLYAPQPLLPEMAAALGVTPAAAGSVIGATTLAVAVAAPAAGPLVDRFGCKASILAAIVLVVPLSVLIALCASLEQVLVVRFLQGVVLPALFTGATACVARRWKGASGAPAMGVYVCGSACGGFAGRLLAGVLSGPLGWQGSLAILAGVSAVCIPVIAAWLPPDGPRGPGGLAGHVRAMAGHLANPELRAACLFGAAVLFSMTGTLSYVGFRLAGPPFLLTPAEIGMVFLVYPFAAAVAPFNGQLLRHLGTRGALLAAVGLCAAGQMALLVPGLAVTALGVALFITGIFLCQSLALGFVGRSARHGAGAAAGLYVCCFYLGGSLGSVGPGLAWDVAGWTGCVALVMAALAVAALASAGMADPACPATTPGFAPTPATGFAIAIPAESDR